MDKNNSSCFYSARDVPGTALSVLDRSQETYREIHCELTQMKTLRALTERESQWLSRIFMDFICFFSECRSIIIPNMSLVKIRREINKSNFYGTIWSQASEEAVKSFIATLCLGLTHFFL